MNTIDKNLLGKIACPACENRPILEEMPEGLACAQCDRIYRVTEDGIPVLLIDEAIMRTNKRNPTAE